ncbi:hypothetical protein NN561_019334 [Cricetulus griseus]
MVTSFSKSVQPRNCEATRSCPTEKGNTLPRAAAHVTEHRHSLQTSVKSRQRAAHPSSHPTRAFSSRAGTLGKPQPVPGPSAFRLSQGQAPGAQASGDGGRARGIPSGLPQGPRRSSGSGHAGGQQRRGPRQPLLAAAAPATPPLAALQSQGSFRSGDREEFSPQKKKRNPAGTRRRPASRPKQQPRSARESHSPTRRC